MRNITLTLMLTLALLLNACGTPPIIPTCSKIKRVKITVTKNKYGGLNKYDTNKILMAFTYLDNAVKINNASINELDLLMRGEQSKYF